MPSEFLKYLLSDKKTTTETETQATEAKPYSRFREIPKGYMFQEDKGGRGDFDTPLVTVPKTARFSTMIGGGQYTIDPGKDTPYKSVAVYVPKTLKKMRAGLSPSMFEIDHIIPLWAGGTDNPENKVKLTNAEHDRKTKIEAVTRELYYAGTLTKAQSRLMNAQALARTDIDLSEIKLDSGGNLTTESGTAEEATAFALKKKLDWEKPQEFKVGFKEVWNEIKDNSILGRFGKSVVSGLTGSWVNPEQTAPEKGHELEAKVTEATGQVVGTIGSFVLLEGLATQVLGRLGILSKASKYVAGNKYLKGSGNVINATKTTEGTYSGGIQLSRNTALKALKNAGLFSLQGQLSKQENDEFGTRIERFVKDATMGSMMALPGVSKTATDYVKNYGGLFAGSYALSKVEGASDEDAIIGSTILVGLHGLGEKARIKSEEIMGTTVAMKWRTSQGIKIDPNAKFDSVEINRQNKELNDILNEAIRVNPALSVDAINSYKAKMVITGRQLYKGGLTSEKRLMEDYYDTVSLIRREKNSNRQGPSNGMSPETETIISSNIDKLEVPKQTELDSIQQKVMGSLGVEEKPIKIILAGPGLDIMSDNVKAVYEAGTKDVILIRERNETEIQRVKDIYTAEGKTEVNTINDPSDIVRIFAKDSSEEYRDIGTVPTSAYSGWAEGSLTKPISTKGYKEETINANMRQYDWGDKEVPQNAEGINNSYISRKMQSAGVDVMTGTIDFITPSAENSKRPSVTIRIEPRDYVAALRQEVIARTATEKINDLPIQQGKRMFTEPLEKMIEAISSKKINKIISTFNEMYGGSRLSKIDARTLTKSDSNVGTFIDIVEKMKVEGKLTETGMLSYNVIHEYFNSIKSDKLTSKIRNMNLLGGKKAENIRKSMAEKEARAEEPAILTSREISIGESVSDALVEVAKENAVRKEIISKESAEMSSRNISPILDEVVDAKVPERKEVEVLAKENPGEEFIEVENVNGYSQKEEVPSWRKTVQDRKGEEGIIDAAVKYIKGDKSVLKEFTTTKLTEIAKRVSGDGRNLFEGWGGFYNEVVAKIRKANNESKFDITNKNELRDMKWKYRRMADSHQRKEIDINGNFVDGAKENKGDITRDIEDWLVSKGMKKDAVEVIDFNKSILANDYNPDMRETFKKVMKNVNEKGQLLKYKGNDPTKPYIEFTNERGGRQLIHKETGTQLGKEDISVIKNIKEKTEIADGPIPYDLAKEYIAIGLKAKGPDKVMVVNYNKEIANMFTTKHLVEGEDIKSLSPQDKFLRVLLVEAVGLKKDFSDIDMNKRSGSIGNRYDRPLEADKDYTTNLRTIDTVLVKDLIDEQGNRLSTVKKEEFLDPNHQDVEATIESYDNYSKDDGQIYAGWRIFDKTIADSLLDPIKNKTSFKGIIKGMVIGKEVDKEMILHKGHFTREDGAILDMLKQHGIELGPDDIVSFNTNAKIGKKLTKIKLIRRDIVTKPVGASEDINIGPSITSKFSAKDSRIAEDIIAERNARIEKLNNFGKEMMETKGGEEFDTVLTKYAKEYNLDKDNFFYGTIGTAKQLGAAKNKLAHSIDKIFKNIFMEDVYTDKYKNGQGVFVGTMMKLKFDGHDKPARYPKDTELVLGEEAIKNSNLNDGESVVLYRYPVLDVNNMIVVKVVDGTKLGHSSLGNEVGFVNPKVERLILGGDQDGDTMNFVKIGEGGVPQSMADAINVEGGKIMPFKEVVKLPGRPITVKNMVEKIESQLVGDVQTTANAIVKRMRTIVEGNKISVKIYAAEKGNKKSRYELLSGDNVVETGEIGAIEKGFTVKHTWSMDKRQRTTQAIVYGLDSKSSSNSLDMSSEFGISGDPDWAFKTIWKKSDGSDLSTPEVNLVKKTMGNIEMPFKLERMSENTANLPKLLKKIEPAVTLIEKIKNSGMPITPFQALFVHTARNIKPFEVTDAQRSTADLRGATAVAKAFPETVIETKINGLFDVVSDNHIVSDFRRKMINASTKYNEKNKKGKSKLTTKEKNEMIYNDIVVPYNKLKDEGKLTTEDHKQLAILAATSWRANIAHGAKDFSRKKMIEGKDPTKSFIQFTTVNNKKITVQKNTGYLISPAREERIGNGQLEIVPERITKTEEDNIEAPPFEKSLYVRRLDDIIHDSPEVAGIFYKAADPLIEEDSLIKEIKSGEYDIKPSGSNRKQEDLPPEAYGIEEFNVNSDIPPEVFDTSLLETDADIDLRTVKGALEKTPVIIEGPTGRVRANGTKVNASFDRKSNEITIDKEAISETFKDKPWTKPKVEGVIPLPEKIFKMPEEWENFNFNHELAHTKSVRKSNESLAEYENRINSIALKNMGLTSKYNSLMKKVKKQPVQSTLFDSSKKKVEETPFDGEGGMGDWFSGLKNQVSSWFSNMGKSSFTVNNNQNNKPAAAPAVPRPAPVAEVRPSIAPPSPTNYPEPKVGKYKVRDMEVSDNDIKEAANILYAEISNRAPERQQFELRNVVNVALNRMAAKPGSTLTSILQAPYQFQGYAPKGIIGSGGKEIKSQYQKLRSGDLDEPSRRKLETILNALEELKSGQFSDTTDGAKYYVHASDGTIWLGKTIAEAKKNALDHEKSIKLQRTKYGTAVGLPLQ